MAENLLRSDPDELDTDPLDLDSGIRRHPSSSAIPVSLTPLSLKAAKTETLDRRRQNCGWRFTLSFLPVLSEERARTNDVCSARGHGDTQVLTRGREVEWI